MSEDDQGRQRLERLDALAARRWALTTRAVFAARRSEIDALNVFPVPDGDTGTNLYLTLDSALDAVARRSARGRPGSAGAGPRRATRRASPGPRCSRPAATPGSSSASSCAGSAEVVGQEADRAGGRRRRAPWPGRCAGPATWPGRASRARWRAPSSRSPPRPPLAAEEAAAGDAAPTAVRRRRRRARRGPRPPWTRRPRSCRRSPAPASSTPAPPATSWCWSRCVHVISGAGRRTVAAAPTSAALGRPQWAPSAVAGRRAAPASAGGPAYEVMFLLADSDPERVAALRRGARRARRLPARGRRPGPLERPRARRRRGRGPRGRHRGRAAAPDPGHPPGRAAGGAASGPRHRRWRSWRARRGTGWPTSSGPPARAWCTARPGRRASAGQILDEIRAVHALSVIVLPNDSDTQLAAEAAARAAADEGVEVHVVPLARRGAGRRRARRLRPRAGRRPPTCWR